MKIAHLPFCYYPDPVGGTEVYVRSLAREQRRLGHDPFIIAPAEQDATYEQDGMRVHRYAVADTVSDIRELYHARNSVAIDSFSAILEREQPAVLHVHGYGRAVTSAMLERARAQGCAIVLTYHTPAATCMRGSLLRFGESVCDGALDAQRCAACVLQSRGVPRVLASIAAMTPRWPTSMLRAGRTATGLRMRELVRLRHAEIERALQLADHVVAPAQWVLELLLRLGVPRDRITLSRQGIANEPLASKPHASGRPVKLVFLGRLDRGKGLDVLLQALSAAADLPIELHVYALQQSADAYGATVLEQAGRDARVRLHEPFEASELLHVLAGYDALVAPSQLLETGPLVVLEAFAAGLPVIGSRLGGIAELVRDGVNGLLVDATDVAAWSTALRRIVVEPALLTRLRAGVQPPRTMALVAAEMAAVYARLVPAA